MNKKYFIVTLMVTLISFLTLRFVININNVTLPLTDEKRQQTMVAMEKFRPFCYAPTSEQQERIDANISTFILLPHGEYELAETGVIKVSEPLEGSEGLISWTWQNNSEVVIFAITDGRIIAHWTTIDRIRIIDDRLVIL